MTERTEIIIVDDDEKDRIETSRIVRKFFPDHNITEFLDADSALTAVTAQTRDEIFLVISDSQTEKSGMRRVGTFTADGIDLLSVAKENGVPHAVFYSISAPTYLDMLRERGIVSVAKKTFRPNQPQTDETNTLEQFLRGIQ